MEKAFAGLTALDFSTTIAGPYCARLLADMGANVIKVESPEGDVMRTRPPQRAGVSTAFGQVNAGKKSIVLDLKSPSAIEAAKKLVAKADILVENFRPGVMARLGLDYASLAPDNPRLIYCALSGYGQTGPSAQKPAYAPVIHAASGYDLAQNAYQRDASNNIREIPDYCGIYLADVVAGIYGFSAIGAALHQRHATGRGQLIDVSMLESMLSLTFNEVQAAQFPVERATRPMFGPMATSDGYVIAAVVREKSFRGFVTAAGRPDFIRDPRFAQFNERRINWATLMEAVESWSRTLTSQECIAILERHDVPCSAYRTVAEAMADPQIAHRGVLSDVHDEAGVFQAFNPPFRMSGALTQIGATSPRLGQHNQEVLGAAGFTPDEIAKLAGALG